MDQVIYLPKNKGLPIAWMGTVGMGDELCIRRAQSVRFERVQFVQILSGPFDGAFGLNFVVLHMYGGHLTVPFLNRDDRVSFAALLQQKGVFHAP